MEQLLYKRTSKVLRLIAVSAILVAFEPSFAQNDNVPKHLSLARELLQNVPKEKNRYSHTDQISFPTEVFASGYSMNADCSGFVSALLSRASSPTLNQMIKVRPSRTRPLSEDFTLSIIREKGFKRIDRVDEISLGDIFAWEFSNFLDAKAAKNTGHTMIIDSTPKKIKPRNPFIENTEQYEVWVIDSSRGTHGPDDTRKQDKDEEIDGLGRGRFRLYADKDGIIVGFAKNFKNSKFHSLSESHSKFSEDKPKIGAVGRPVY